MLVKFILSIVLDFARSTIDNNSHTLCILSLFALTVLKSRLKQSIVLVLPYRVFKRYNTSLSYPHFAKFTAYRVYAIEMRNAKLVKAFNKRFARSEITFCFILFLFLFFIFLVDTRIVATGCGNNTGQPRCGCICLWLLCQLC